MTNLINWKKYAAIRAGENLHKNIRYMAIPKGKRLTEKQKRQVKALIRGQQELKYFVTTSGGPVSVNSTPLIVGMTSIAQGDTDVTRDGDRINLCGTFEFNVLFNVVNGDEGQGRPMMRLIFFQWKPQSEDGGATEPAASAILNVGGVTGATIDSTSTYNHDQRQNYKILYDRLVKLTSTGQSAAAAYNTNMARELKIRIPIGKRVTKRLQYNAGSAVIATNHIYFMIYSNDAADAQNPLMYYSSKIFYHDS